MIRVFLAEDHAVLRDGLRRILAETGDISVVGDTDDGEEVLRRAALERWDVVVLDLGLRNLDGAAVLRALRSDHPRLPVLILSMHPEDGFALRLLAAGAAGFVHKARPASAIVEAIRKVARGGRYITPELADRLLEQQGAGAEDPVQGLTDRQLEILRLIGQGRSPSEVATALGLRASTVSTHLHHIKTRLGARTLGELVHYALRAGLA